MAPNSFLFVSDIMDRTALLAFLMVWIIAVGLVAESGADAQCQISSGSRRILRRCKKSKIAKAKAAFKEDLSNIETTR